MGEKDVREEARPRGVESEKERASEHVATERGRETERERV